MDVKKAVSDVKGGKIDFKVDKKESFMHPLEKHLLMPLKSKKMQTNYLIPS